MNSADDTLAGGFPHSEIPGSKPARGSPELFAACYVLHRLSVPRHPPDALKRLIPQRHAQEQYRCPLAASKKMHPAQTNQPALPAGRPIQALPRSQTLFTCPGSRSPSGNQTSRMTRPVSLVCFARIFLGRGAAPLGRRKPRKRMVEAIGIEPTTSCLQSTRSPN